LKVDLVIKMIAFFSQSGHQTVLISILGY